MCRLPINDDIAPHNLLETAALFGQRPLEDYIEAGRQLSTLRKQAAADSNITFNDLIADLPVSRRQIGYLLDIYDHRAELRAAGIQSFSAAIVFLRRLRASQQETAL